MKTGLYEQVGLGHVVSRLGLQLLWIFVQSSPLQKFLWIFFGFLWISLDFLWKLFGFLWIFFGNYLDFFGFSLEILWISLDFCTVESPAEFSFSQLARLESIAVSVFVVF